MIGRVRKRKRKVKLKEWLDWGEEKGEAKGKVREEWEHGHDEG